LRIQRIGFGTPDAVAYILNYETMARKEVIGMKKLIVMAVSILIAVSLAVAAAADEPVKVKGTVSKIDEAAKSVTIQPKEGDAVTVIMEDADLLSKVKEGGKGQATYTVKDGIKVGLKLKKLSEGCD
jgi:hypothetical protein